MPVTCVNGDADGSPVQSLARGLRLRSAVLSWIRPGHVALEMRLQKPARFTAEGVSSPSPLIAPPRPRPVGGVVRPSLPGPPSWAPKAPSLAPGAVVSRVPDVSLRRRPLFPQLHQRNIIPILALILPGLLVTAAGSQAQHLSLPGLTLTGNSQGVLPLSPCWVWGSRGQRVHQGLGARSFLGSPTLGGLALSPPAGCTSSGRAPGSAAPRLCRALWGR